MNTTFVIEYEEHYHGETSVILIERCSSLKQAQERVEAYFSEHILLEEPESYLVRYDDLYHVAGFAIKGTHGDLHRYINITEISAPN